MKCDNKQVSSTHPFVQPVSLTTAAHHKELQGGDETRRITQIGGTHRKRYLN